MDKFAYTISASIIMEECLYVMSCIHNGVESTAFADPSYDHLQHIFIHYITQYHMGGQ